MFQRYFHRSLSLGLAAVLTVGMLGGIDTLSQLDDAAPIWAQQTSPSRA